MTTCFGAVGNCGDVYVSVFLFVTLFFAVIRINNTSLLCDFASLLVGYCIIVELIPINKAKLVDLRKHCIVTLKKYPRLAPGCSKNLGRSRAGPSRA